MIRFLPVGQFKESLSLPSPCIMISWAHKSSYHLIKETEANWSQISFWFLYCLHPLALHKHLFLLLSSQKHYSNQGQIEWTCLGPFDVRSPAGACFPPDLQKRYLKTSVSIPSVSILFISFLNNYLKISTWMGQVPWLSPLPLIN